MMKRVNGKYACVNVTIMGSDVPYGTHELKNGSEP